MDLSKPAYICGPLTELGPETKKFAMRLYERIADICQEAMNIRAFVPHEHYDPIKHKSYTPTDVDRAERDQVMNKTSVLIVLPIAPSWGGGIEVEMARQKNVPVILLCEKDKLESRLISRLLRGNPAVVAELSYGSEIEACAAIKEALAKMSTEAVA